jgi:hypothetical protein
LMIAVLTAREPSHIRTTRDPRAFWPSGRELPLARTHSWFSDHNPTQVSILFTSDRR